MSSPADRPDARQIADVFQLERMPRVPAGSYYDVVAQVVADRSGNWAAQWHEHEARAFYEVCLARSLRVWPLCRRDAGSATLSEQAAFLIQ